MNREIRFRAFYKGEWYQPALVGGTQVPQVFIEKRGLVNLCAHTEEYFVCQFTGLKDKNGKEIYEGDILLNDVRELLGYIYWEDAQMRARWKYYKPRKDQRTDFFVSGHITQEEANDFEIIGNIYENPELLS